jgi:chemotaxis response regulator CheB
MIMKVLFLNQQQLLRETFTAAFSRVAGIVVLPPVSDVLDAIDSILQDESDVIQVDVNPSLFGLQMARDLQDACPTCPIIMLSTPTRSLMPS